MTESKNESLEGLEEQENVETTTKKSRKVQTVEEKEVLEAGVAQMQEIGVSENLEKVLALVDTWNGGDKEALAEAKKTAVEAFGGSDVLKDYIGGDFKEEIKSFNGIAKTMPVLNNIKAFYERRKTTATRKAKPVQISIDGVTYNINPNYREEIKDLPKEERKELLLKHADTKKAEIEELI